MHLCATNADGVWRRDHENEVTPRDENRGTWCSASRLLAGPSQAQSFYNQLLFIFNFHTTILNLFTLCGSRLHSTSPGSHTHTHTHHTHTHRHTDTHTHTWFTSCSVVTSHKFTGELCDCQTCANAYQCAVAPPPDWRGPTSSRGLSSPSPVPSW